MTTPTPTTLDDLTPGTTVLLLVKPFVNSDVTEIHEVGVIEVRRLGMDVTRNGRGCYHFARSIILEWTISEG